MEKNDKPHRAGELIEKLFGSNDELMQTFKSLSSINTKKSAERALNQRIRRMRTMNAFRSEPSYLPTEKSVCFTAQARYMKIVQSDSYYHAEYSSYLPSFGEMSDAQLKTYFYLRTQLRRGRKISLTGAYRLLYIYELIGNIEGANIEERSQKLASLRTADDDRNFRWLLKAWIKDYYICEDFGVSFEEYAQRLKAADMFDEELSDIDYAPGHRYEALNKAMRLAVNRFSELLPPQYLAECFEAVSDEIERFLSPRGLSLQGILFGRERKTYRYVPFRGALYAPDKPIRRKSVRISAKEAYECNNGVWTRIHFETYCNKNVAGLILRLMENRLRELSSYRYRLSVPILTAPDGADRKLSSTIALIGSKEFAEVIERAAEAYFHDGHELQFGSAKKSKRESPKPIAAPIRERPSANTPNSPPLPPSISLDRSKIDEVRQDTERLEAIFVYDETDFASTAAPELPTETPTADEQDEWAAFAIRLSETERRALALLLDGKIDELKQLANKSGSMSEIIMESINEKALDCLGDNIISFDEEQPRIYEEYTAEAMRIMKGY